MDRQVSLREIAAGLREGALSSRDLVETAIANNAAHNTRIGAYMTWAPQAASQCADLADRTFAAGVDLGPLHGIPVNIKDVFGVRGTRTHSGASQPLPEPFDVEGTLVAALQSQMAPVMGKTHTDEFAYGGIGMVSHWGTPRNPWDAATARVAGGSSSGAGASLLEGSSLVALASDTSGSVRRPASMTGTVGLKVTHGRWPVDGMVPLAPSLDTAGILACTVEDTAFAFAALDGGSTFRSIASAATGDGVAGLRLGICDNILWDECQPGIAEAVQETVRDLEKAGAHCISLDLPEVDEALAVVRDGGIVASEFYAILSKQLPDFIDRLHPLLGGRLAGSDRPRQSAVDYIDNLTRLERASASIAQRLAAVDLIICPTVPITPPLIEDVRELAPYEAANRLAVRNTYVPSLLNLCALSMPAGLDACAMPVGMQVIMPGRCEERLLACAMRIERCIGTSRQRLGVAPLVA
jgi:aspartyl-tRNA(Asn)/glutamyl-tRNA(Gln) amidotransferase subunit A